MAVKELQLCPGRSALRAKARHNTYRVSPGKTGSAEVTRSSYTAVSGQYISKTNSRPRTLRQILHVMPKLNRNK